MVTDDAGEISIADERSVPSRDGSSSGAKMTTTYNSYEEARKRRVAEHVCRRSGHCKLLKNCESNHPSI
jgi:hypothetical protein